MVTIERDAIVLVAGSVMVIVIAPTAYRLARGVVEVVVESDDVDVDVVVVVGEASCFMMPAPTMTRRVRTLAKIRRRRRTLIRRPCLGGDIGRSVAVLNIDSCSRRGATALKMIDAATIQLVIETLTQRRGDQIDVVRLSSAT